MDKPELGEYWADVTNSALGMSVWVSFRQRDVQERDLDYDEDQVGYAKLHGEWGLALRRIRGNTLAEQDTVDGPWRFNSAPRELRLAGVEKIPELVEVLGKEAFKITNKIQEKTALLHGLTAAIVEPSEPVIFRPNQSDAGSAGGPAKEFEAIRTILQKQQKFLWSMIEHASYWELRGTELRLYFPRGSQSVADMLKGRETLRKLKGIAEEVLGRSIQVVVQLESEDTASSSDRRAE